ncbi:MAG TPA: hypothetical protein VGK19_01880 [Capsulimonadaceae bacterium]|jgi:hypothetical protein
MNPTINPPVARQYGTGWLNEAWELFKPNAVPWVMAVIAAVVMQFVIVMILEVIMIVPMTVATTLIHGGSSASSTPFWMYPVMGLLVLMQAYVQAYFTGGFLKMGIAAMRRQNVRLEDLFTAWNVTLPLFLYNLILTLPGLVISVLGGYIGGAISASTFNWGLIGLFVVMWLVGVCGYTLILPGQVLVVDGVRIKEAYRRSISGILKHVGPVTVVGLLITLLYILGIFTCGIGWLALAPVTLIVIALVARDVCDLPGNVGPDEVVYFSPTGAWPPPPSHWTPVQTTTTDPTVPSGEPPTSSPLSSEFPPSMFPPRVPAADSVSDEPLPDVLPVDPPNNDEPPTSPPATGSSR